jgi:AcrR family transcriptional regulator
MSSIKKQILNAALALLAEKGISGVSMRAVAGRVGVTATAIYRHWADKDALIHEVIMEGHRLFGTYLVSALEGRTPRKRLELAREAYLRFALECRHEYQVLFMTPCPTGKSLPEELEVKAHANYQMLLDRVHECLEAGIFKPGQPEEIALTIWAQCHGLITLHFSGSLADTGIEFPTLFHSACEVLSRGLNENEPFLPSNSKSAAPKKPVTQRGNSKPRKTIP